MIRHIKKPIKPLWYLLALAIVLFAMLLQAARWAAPHIDYFQGSLENFASRQLNAQVSIGSISARWPGLLPEVVVDNLSVKTESAPPFLKIKRASMKLDILSSLFHWVPVWRQVAADGIKLTLTQDDRGGWSVGGLQPSQQGRSWRYRSPSSLFLMARDVKLDTADITFSFHSGRQLLTHIPSIDIQNNGHFHRLDAKAAIGDDSIFNFILEGVGDPAIPEQFFAKAYLKLNQFPVERLVQLLSQVTIDNNTGDSKAGASSQISESEAALELWFDFASPSRFLMDGHVALLNNQSSRFAQNNYLDIPFSADISGDYSIDSGLVVGLRNALVDNKLSLSSAHILLHKNEVNIATESIQLEPWIDWSKRRLFRVPQAGNTAREKINEILDELSPSGRLHNLHFTVDLSNVLNSKLRTNVYNVNTKAWRNVPGFQNVNGYVETHLNEGFILLDTKGFSLFQDKIYSAPITSQYAKGMVAWELMLKDKKAKVYGAELNMVDDYGNANGNFLLDLAWGKKNKEKNQSNALVLQIGLQNSNAIFHRQLVPNVLPKNLLEWMDSSIKNGEVKKAGLFYRGGLKKTSRPSVQFFADLNQGELDFSSDWPALDNIDGNLLIDNNQLYGKINSTTIFGDEKLQGYFSWNDQYKNVLKVEASGRASTSSGLQYVRESWLNKRVGDITKQVSVKGNVAVKVDLDIPLNKSTAVANHEVALDFYDSQLKFKELGLSFGNIQGELYYSTEQGFLSKDLAGTLFEKPIAVSVRQDNIKKSIANLTKEKIPKANNLETKGSEKKSLGKKAASDFFDALAITGTGVADISSVNEWIQHPVFSFVEGQFEYDFAITLPNDSDVQPTLSVQSDLLGVISKLPGPYRKQADKRLLFSFNMPLQPDVLDYKFNLGTYFSGRYRLKGSPESKGSYAATLAFSDVQAPDFIKLPKEGIKIFGQFNQFDISEWSPFFKSYPREKNAETPAVDLFIAVDELKMQNHSFKNILLSGQREQQGWSLIVDSDDILGGVYIDDDRKRPIVADIDYFNWPSEEAGFSEEKLISVEKVNKKTLRSDPLKNINPSTLPAIDVTIDRLVFKDKPLGRWSFELRSDNESLEVRNIVATAAGFSLMGENKKAGAYLRWQPEVGAAPLSTRFSGAIVGGDPKALFDQWGLPVVLRSDETNINFDLFWPGSPLFFSIETLKGTIDSRYKKGVFTQETTDDATDVLRLFGLFNFDSWARRIRLDFSDIYKKGIVFDDLRGSLTFDDGLIEISNPITMKGPSSRLALSGLIDYPAQTVDARLVATLPVGGNLTVAVALAAGLPAAAGVYVVSKLFEKQVAEVSSINYTINGSWNDPVVKVDNIEGNDPNGINSDSESSETAGS